MSTEQEILTAEGEHNPFTLTDPRPEWITCPERCGECGQKLRRGDSCGVCFDCKREKQEEEARYEIGDQSADYEREPIEEVKPVIQAKVEPSTQALALTAGEWAKRKGMGEAAIQHCRSFALEAERKMGEMLAATEKQEGGRPPKTSNRVSPVSDKPTLADLGVSKRESVEAQAISALPREIFKEPTAGNNELPVLPDAPPTLAAPDVSKKVKPTIHARINQPGKPESFRPLFSQAEKGGRFIPKKVADSDGIRKRILKPEVVEKLKTVAWWIGAAIFWITLFLLGGVQ
ncbi:MAG: hypothetical protein HY343_11995 [Lentisphaerae bacterium]|nr:hypothetical protein [Lentisphaerota bacterium]